jgi:hypothetical protein
MKTTRLSPIYRNTSKPPEASGGNVPNPAEARTEDLLPPRRIDQRLKGRFPIQLRVSYRTLGQGYSRAGVGRVVNISSAGVLVASQLEPKAGTRMELNIDWPAKLDGRVSLQLLIMGRVVRCEMSSFALALGRHQFRTRGSTGGSE